MASTPAPLRPGPAGPDRAAELRDRILDAAVACIVEEGLNARLHALIAHRAGVSRPTVYKYVGDQDAVLAALVDREIDRFFAVVLPLLRVGEDVVPDLIDGITLIVDYARRHELLQIALRDHPEVVLPALTTRSAPILDRCLALFARPLGQALALEDEQDARLVTEWLFRVIVSLITTPGTVGQSREDVQAHVTRLLAVIGVREHNRA
ncbi:MAG TPA: TetR/AcrR family transcriptional regulator [Nocardioides sp.]|nr:TetR/AcrR family transcriptional regulator [Nocardioides sp.]